MGSITSASLLHQYNEITLQLALRGFHVAVSVCDGAGENRAFNRISAEVPASTFFSTTEAASWAAKGINLDFKVAKDSLLTPGDMYTFHLSDFPHALKKIVNAMEMSSKSSSGRDLKASNEECRNVSSLFKRPGSRPKGPCGFPGGPPCGFASIKAAETLCKTLHGVTKNHADMRTADAEALYKKHARFYPILPMAPAALRVGSYEHAYDFYPGPGKVRVGENGGIRIDCLDRSGVCVCVL